MYETAYNMIKILVIQSP